MLLENDQIRVTLDPNKGAALSGFYYKSAGLNFIASSGASIPEASVHALFQGMRFETISTSQNESATSATLSARSQDASLKLSKTLTLKKGEIEFEIAETIENLGAQEREILWGLRVPIGPPFLDGHNEIQAPAVSYFDPREEPILRMRWPKLADGTDLSTTRCARPEEAKTFLLTDFGQGLCRVISRSRKFGVEVCWDEKMFPYCWLEESAERLCLSPFTGLPNALEEGHGTLTLPAGDSATARFALRIAPMMCCPAR